jgi:hypothetical protein
MKLAINISTETLSIRQNFDSYLQIMMGFTPLNLSGMTKKVQSPMKVAGATDVHHAVTCHALSNISIRM